MTLEDLIEKWQDVLDCADPDDITEQNLAREILEDLQECSRSKTRNS